MPADSPSQSVSSGISGRRSTIALFIPGIPTNPLSLQAFHATGLAAIKIAQGCSRSILVTKSRILGFSTGSKYKEDGHQDIRPQFLFVHAFMVLLMVIRHSLEVSLFTLSILQNPAPGEIDYHLLKHECNIYCAVNCPPLVNSTHPCFKMSGMENPRGLDQ